MASIDAKSTQETSSTARTFEYGKQSQKNQSNSFTSQVQHQQQQFQTSVLSSQTKHVSVDELKPKILATMPDRRADLDGKAVFSCEYSAAPSEKTQINWYHNSILITKSENQQKYVIRNDNNRSILFVLNLNYEDSGIYEIRIINKHGIVSQSARLFVGSGN